MATITDMPFDSAADVRSIKYRFAPIDLGFDPRASALRINISKSDDPMRASYATREGSRRVVEGPQSDVLRHLRRHGYRFQRV